MNTYEECGQWPANAVTDITNMRNTLIDDCDRGILFKLNYGDFVFVAHSRIIRRLELMVTRSGESYMNYLLHNNILHSIITDNSLEGWEGYLYTTNKGMPFTKDVEGVRLIPKDTFIQFISLTSKWEDEEGSDS